MQLIIQNPVKPFWLKLKMSDSESDELVLIQSSLPKRRRVEAKPVENVRNNRADGDRQHATRHILALNSDGPPCIVAVIGSATGRWNGALTSPFGHSASAWLARHQQSLRLDEDDHNYDQGDGVVLYGFAVICTYRFALPGIFETNPLIKDAHRLFKGLVLRYGDGRCVGLVGLVMLPVRATAYFADPISIDPEALERDTPTFAAYISDVVGTRQIEEASLSYKRPSDETDTEQRVSWSISCKHLLREWEASYAIKKELAVPRQWNLYPTFADVLSRGGLPCDYYTVLRGDRKKIRVAPGLPPEKIVLVFLDVLAKEAADRVSVGADGSGDRVSRDSGRPTNLKNRRTYHPDHLRHAIKTSADVVNQDKMKRVVANTLELCYPEKSKEMLEELEADGFRVPQRNLLQRSRIRFDVVAMLARRHYNQTVPNISRQLMFDASPIKGVEIFSFRERVIVNGDVESSVTRRMPHYDSWSGLLRSGR